VNKILCTNCRDNQDDQARTDFGFSITEKLNLKSPDFVPVNFMQYYSLQSIEQFKTDEKQRPNTGQYVFMHLEVPHPPYIYNEECTTETPITDYRYKRDGTPFYDYYVKQSACSIKLLNEITQTIKEAGNYEEAMIIVHSDHGFKFMLLPNGERKSYYELSQEQRSQADKGLPLHQSLLASFTDVIFFIKPPKDVKVSNDIPIHPIDIKPIIFEHFGLSTTHLNGLNLQQLHTVSQEERSPQKLYFNFFKMPELVPDAFLTYERKNNEWSPTRSHPLTWKGKKYHD
jgi:arylsulfatase A-like enzyme